MSKISAAQENSEPVDLYDELMMRQTCSRFRLVARKPSSCDGTLTHSSPFFVPEATKEQVEALPWRSAWSVTSWRR